VATWKTPAHLEDHFRKHGRRLGFPTVQAYDASAQATIAVGRYVEYYDDDTGETRLGCFDAPTGRFVVLTLDDEIVSHYFCSVRYVRGLSYSNYDQGEE
jgi:hypothetical protein